MVGLLRCVKLTQILARSVLALRPGVMVITVNVPVGKRGVEVWLLKWMVTKLAVVAINETGNSSNFSTSCWLLVLALVGSPGLAGTTSVSC